MVPPRTSRTICRLTTTSVTGTTRHREPYGRGPMACECSHQGTPPPPDYRQPERHLLSLPLSLARFASSSGVDNPRPRATFSTAASVNVRLPPRLSRRLYACRQAPSWASWLVSGARRAPLPRGCEGVPTPSRCRRLIWRRVTSRLAKGYWAHQTL